MTKKQEIEESEAFKAVSSSTPRERYEMLISKHKGLCEGHWNCTITEAPYVAMIGLPEGDIALAVDGGMGTRRIAIIHPL